MAFQIFVPIYEVAHYALYAFDMEKKMVNILDPVRDTSKDILL
jgi:Ulp1 family protease